MKVDHNARIIIADSEVCLEMKNNGDKTLMDLRVLGKTEYNNPPTRMQGTDRPGRTLTHSNQVAALSQSDWHEIGKKNAAEAIAKRLNNYALKSEIPEIVLIADAKTIGHIRLHLAAAAKEKIIEEIVKDLTHQTIQDIENIISAV